MKIIHLCNYFQPKLGYQEYFLAREHVRLGHEVFVLTSDRFFPFPDYEKTVKPILGDRITGSGVSELDGFKIIRLNILFEFSARLWFIGLKKIITDIKPDIVICHGMASLNSIRIAGLKEVDKFKLIYDDHMLFSEENKSFAGNFFYNFFNFKKIIKNADRLIGVSTECVDFIEKKYGFPKNKIEMIPLGADSELFKYDENKKNVLRSNLGINNNSVVITYTGKLTIKKGPHNILLAIEKILDKLQHKITLLFVGNIEDNYKDLFEKHKNKLEKLIQIINIPAVENHELVSIYSASDITVWPRQGSMSMIEASSCGVPIICCDFLTERYKNNNGIPIKEDDIDCLSEAILKLANNKNLRLEMGKNGRILIEKEMSWNVIAKKVS